MPRPSTRGVRGWRSNAPVRARSGVGGGRQTCSTPSAQGPGVGRRVGRNPGKGRSPTPKSRRRRKKQAKKGRRTIPNGPAHPHFKSGAWRLDDRRAGTLYSLDIRGSSITATALDGREEARGPAGGGGFRPYLRRPPPATDRSSKVSDLGRPRLGCARTGRAWGVGPGTDPGSARHRTRSGPSSPRDDSPVRRLRVEQTGSGEVIDTRRGIVTETIANRPSSPVPPGEHPRRPGPPRPPTAETLYRTTTPITNLRRSSSTSNVPAQGQVKGFIPPAGFRRPVRGDSPTAGSTPGSEWGRGNQTGLNPIDRGQQGRRQAGHRRRKGTAIPYIGTTLRARSVD